MRQPRPPAEAALRGGLGEFLAGPGHPLLQAGQALGEDLPHAVQLIEALPVQGLGQQIRELGMPPGQALDLQEEVAAGARQVRRIGAQIGPGAQATATTFR